MDGLFVAKQQLYRVLKNISAHGIYVVCNF